MRIRSGIFRSTTFAATLLLAGAVAAFLAYRNSEPPVQPKAYVIGETAREEIVAPKKFTVVDTSETQQRRQTEMARVPAVFRFQKNISDEAVGKFSTEFVFAREKFLSEIEAKFKTHTLTTNQIETPRFRRLFTAFKEENKFFPVNIAEAKKWAQGDTEDDLQKQLGATLRQAAGRFIRADAWPPIGQTFQIRILSDNAARPEMPLDQLRQQSKILRRTNLVALTKARNELLNSFPKNDRAFAKVLTNFVSVNCFFEEELTRRIRAEKENSIWVVSSYEPGQVIVRPGELIDAKIKAALDAIKIQSPPTSAKINSAKKIWLWSAAGFCGALALIIWLRGFAARSRTSLVVARNVVALPRLENEILETKLLPHLARQLMNKFVRRLISQRADLMETQSSGADQLNELEGRLDQIDTRWQMRQIAYETRIAQLERDLALAEEENRELIRAKIREARQNLEWAKAQGNGAR